MSERPECSEVVLPRRAIPQPTPVISPHGGDCGPCALGGVLGWSSPRDVYDRLREGETKAFTWWDMRHAVATAGWQGLIDRSIGDVPLWPFERHPGHLCFGLTGAMMSDAWFRYVRLAIDAGYYGLAQVDQSREGPESETDHYVVIAGARFVFVPHADGGGSYLEEILVSDSARCGPAEEWIEARRFIRERGGYNVILLRPR